MSTERSSRGTSVLSDSDRTILLLTQNHAEKSISSLKDTVDVSEHQLRRAITRFKQLGLYKPLPIVNLSIIGYSRYQVLFSITQYAQQHIVTFKKRLTEHPLIYFFCEIGGDFQYMIGIHAKNLKELDDCLSSISKEFQGAFAERDILPVIEMSFLGTGLLCPRLPRDTPVTWKDQGGSLKLDTISHKLLYTYCNNEIHSMTELSRRAGIPKSTVHYRLAQLEEQGVIVGYVNAFDPVDLKMFPFNILISFRGLTEEREKKIRQIANQYREVDTLVKNLGAWDFTFICFVENARNVMPIVDAIRAEFGDAIDKVTVLPQFHTFKWVEYSGALHYDAK